MRSRSAHWMMLAALTWGSPLAAVAGEPAYLNAAELRGLVTGNTIEASGEQGVPYRVFFDPAGMRVALQPDGEQLLPWRILDDGSHCVTTGTGDDCARVGRDADGSYARYRDGRRVTQWLRILPGRDLGKVAPGLYVRQTGPNQYRLTLIGVMAIPEMQARASLQASAGSLCRAPLMPVMGRYDFDSSQKISGEQAGGGTFRLRQELTCEPGRIAAPAERRPLLRSAEEARRLENQIRARSEAYLRNLAEGDVEMAYADVDGDGMGVDAGTWKNAKLDFRAKAGQLLRLSVWKITVYDNPPAAADPGLYIAADYTNEYQGMALQCGYLMWSRPVGAPDFRIVREEVGNLDAAVLQGLPASELAATRQRFHCEQR